MTVRATGMYFTLLLLSLSTATAQLQLPALEQVRLNSEDYKMSNALHTRGDTSTTLLLRLPSLMPSAYFCKLEHQADAGVKWKRRFRLGSVDYVDRLEGKY